jgi:hypothetical protein
MVWLVEAEDAFHLYHKLQILELSGILGMSYPNARVLILQFELFLHCVRCVMSLNHGRCSSADTSNTIVQVSVPAWDI